MFRKVLVSMFLVLGLTSAAWAQPAKVEVTGIFGYTLADGVSGEPYRAGNGQTYDRVDPKDSMNFGLSLGFFVTPATEVGFLWRRQPTTLEISGTTATDLSDINVDGYHGYVANYFGGRPAWGAPANGMVWNIGTSCPILLPSGKPSVADYPSAPRSLART